MQVPKKQHKRRRLFSGGSQNSSVRHRAQHKDHVWSYDFVTDKIESKGPFRMLVISDEFTHECLAIEVSRLFTAQQVVEVLRYLFAVRGAPKFIRSDNGPEFVARDLRKWLDQADVETFPIAPGSPWEANELCRAVRRQMARAIAKYVESFNGKLWDEFLNGELLPSLAEARWVVDRWWLDYNHHRLHSSLDYQTASGIRRQWTCWSESVGRTEASPLQ